MNNYYIALLRGINVGGHRKVPMADLCDLLTRYDFKDVKTYIQTGNVLFQFLKESTTTIEIKIQKAIANHFGFEVSVLVKTREELQRIFNSCPFSEEKKKNSYFLLLNDIPNAALVKLASEKKYDNEEYKIIDDCIYFYCGNGYGNAKFNMRFFEQKLEVTATSRNYNTMLKLLSLSIDIS